MLVPSESDLPSEILAEYRYKHRSVFGVIGFAIGLVASAGMLFAGFAGHWLWFAPAKIMILATIFSALTFLRNVEQGCSVDQHRLRWWSTAWPRIDNSINVKDILRLQLHTWGDSNQIRIMSVDRSVVELEDRYVGSGQEIFDAIVSLRPDVDVQNDGEYKW